MATYAIVDNNGNVTNLISWDGVESYEPPAGSAVVPWANGAAVGGTYSNGVFAPPSPSPSPPPQIAALQGGG